MTCDLSSSFIKEQLDKGCSYCGELDKRWLGLDRKDNSKGHLCENVVPACERCNYIRRDMPYQAWLMFVPILQEVTRTEMFGEWYPRNAKNRKGFNAEVPPDLRLREPLTVSEILIAADLFHSQYGEWPKSTDTRPVPGHPKDSWPKYDRYLYYGNRGLQGGDTLARLLRRERGDR